MSLCPIRDRVLIGDTRTAALITKQGAIDWMCIPRFDGDPVFGRLIDPDSGGVFSISCARTEEVRRRYLAGSTLVENDITTITGAARLVEGMVANVADTLAPQTLLVRRVECITGQVDLDILFDPRLGLPGRAPERVRAVRSNWGVTCEWGALAVSLSCAPDLFLEPGVRQRKTLRAAESITFVMSVADRSPVAWVGAQKAESLLADTDQWWRGWSGSLDFGGSFKDAVTRSLITLRLLTYSPSGAPVAAPTTSLPESLGAERNWDYRFSWPRDAAIGVVGFVSTGQSGLARSYMHWLLHASRLTRPRLSVLYDIYGRPAPHEHEADVAGYRNSRPVRIGNGARDQHQLDVYGWVIDAAWGLEESGHRLHGETWRALGRFADFVSKSWTEPDAGIWEIRGDPAHYVHSKLMGWLALDRISRMAHGHRVRPVRLQSWQRQRDAIARWIRTNGIDEKRKALVRKAGSTELDASLLILPVIGFEPAGSPLLRGTVDAIREDLEAGDGLILRYPRGADGLDGDEGAFLPCSFWLVQALATIGRVGEAADIFEQLLSHANDVGLFGEELDPVSREHLGNFPQAFTHATLVQADLALRGASEGEQRSA